MRVSKDHRARSDEVTEQHTADLDQSKGFQTSLRSKRGFDAPHPRRLECVSPAAVRLFETPTSRAVGTGATRGEAL